MTSAAVEGYFPPNGLHQSSSPISLPPEPFPALLSQGRKFGGVPPEASRQSEADFELCYYPLIAGCFTAAGVFLLKRLPPSANLSGLVGHSLALNVDLQGKGRRQKLGQLFNLAGPANMASSAGIRRCRYGSPRPYQQQSLLHQFLELTTVSSVNGRQLGCMVAILAAVPGFTARCGL